MSSGPGQVVVVGRAQEAEAVGQHFEHAFREDEPALLGLRLQDLEDQLLLAHPGRAADGQVLRDLRELLDAHVLQIGDVQPLAGPALSLRRRRALAAAAAAAAAVAAACATAARGGWRCGFRLWLGGGAGGGRGGLGGGGRVRGPRRSMALMIAWHEGSRTSDLEVVGGGLTARRIHRGVIVEPSIGLEVRSFKSEV